MPLKELAKKAYGSFLWNMRSVAGADFAKNLDSMVRFHRKLNLKEPKSLADKVSYLELFTDGSMRAQCTDKIEVRSYVQGKGLGNILVPLIMDPVTSADDIDFSQFPEEYVLKATHGCGMNIIHTLENSLDEEEERSICRRWLQTSYGKYSMEPHYLLIQPRVYAEEYLGELDSLIDYKIHCYNGRPSFVLTVSERSKGIYKLHAYTCDWEPIDCIIGPHRGAGSLNPPSSLEEMLRVSELLSQDFEFVRVDLYELQGELRFGELTFTPAACVFPYFSEEFLITEGRKLTIG